MIIEKRIDHKEYKNRRTKKVVPAYFEITYVSKSKYIAWYISKDNKLFLNSKYINHDSKSVVENALNSKYSQEFEELFTLICKLGKLEIDEMPLFENRGARN